MIAELKLIDHIGETPSGLKVDHEQWIVFADDVQIGYLPKTPGAWLQCIVSMDDDVKAELIESINKRVAADIGGVVMPVDPEDEPRDDEEDE
jgi:hypothetical protein